MQKNFTNINSYNFLISILQKVLKEDCLFEKLTEEKIRHIAREEISKMISVSLPNEALFHLSTKDKIFLPYAKWKDKSLLAKFYTNFTIDGFFEHIANDFTKPQFVQLDSGLEALVWTRSSIELVYTFDRLIYQYSAIPISHSLYVQLSDNFLLKKRNSKKTKSPNPFSLETFHSRIRKNKISYPDIDDALKSVFEQ